MDDELVVETQDRVRVIELNRPEKLNAFTGSLITALIASLREAAADETIGAVVLTGRGRAFCAGADRADLTPADPASVLARGRLMVEMRTVFTELDKPVIAGVQGYALGGGAALALSCDIIIAGESFKLGYPELKHGNSPTIALPDLVRQVGRRTAYRLVMTGENLTAQDAMDLHLVYRTVPDDGVKAEAMNVARELAALNPAASRVTKRLISELENLSLLEGLDHAKAQFNALKIPR